LIVARNDSVTEVRSATITRRHDPIAIWERPLQRPEPQRPDATIEAARINRGGVILVSVIGAVATVTAALIATFATRASVDGSPEPEPPTSVIARPPAVPDSSQKPQNPGEREEPRGAEFAVEVRLAVDEGVDVDARQDVAEPADGATGGIDVFLGGGLGFSQLTVSGDGVYAASPTDIPPANQAGTRCPKVVANSTPSPHGVVPVTGVSTCFVTSEGRVAFLTIASAALDGSEAVVQIRAWDS
jgi:hypothetical protein